MAGLSKLQQGPMQSIRDYQAQYEMLANHTTGLTEEFFIRCFVTNLQEDMKHDFLSLILLLCQPPSILLIYTRRN